MIEDLIEGIACYCDTEDKYRALENVCYTFKAPVSIDHSQLSDYIPFKNKTDEEIDRELRKYRTKINKAGKSVIIELANERDPNSMLMDELQAQRNTLALSIKIARGAKDESVSDAISNNNKLVSNPTDSYPLNLINRISEKDDFLKNGYDKLNRSNKDHIFYLMHGLNKDKKKYLQSIPGYVSIGSGIGGAGIGALIGNKIAKKKGWNTRKSRVIGGLIGGITGAGLGYGGSYLYGKHKVQPKIDNLNNSIDKYKEDTNNIINDVKNKYPYYKDQFDKYDRYDPNVFDQFKTTSNK
jgi:hypothetical protein